MYTLRPYQQKAIDMFNESHDAAPCLVLPTGAGKSVIIAFIIKSQENKRTLLLTHQKELIEQDVAKIESVMPDIGVGIYSASIGKKEIGYQVVAASIQSIHRYKGDDSELHFDLVIIDEAHLINNSKQGIYRKFLERLITINPELRILGLTATPYRLGQGMVTDGDLFTSILEPVTVRELIREGFLARLTSKDTKKHFDLSKVAVRGGEFVESELQKAVCITDDSKELVREMIERAGDRKHWLIFCCGVEHAKQISSLLCDNGIAADYVIGSQDKKTRESIIDSFTSGRIRALCNAKVLTTGFDYPDIDCIALLQPTLSPGLYLQEIGRGLRLKSEGGNCLILDFAENVTRHGPVENVQPPAKRGNKKGVAPCKICPECAEILPASARTCSCCGYEFPLKDKVWELSQSSVTEEEVPQIKADVIAWSWDVRTSMKGNRQIVITYQTKAYTRRPICEYLQVTRNDWKGYQDQRKLDDILRHYDITWTPNEPLTDEKLCWCMSYMAPPPSMIIFEDKKYPNVIFRSWSNIRHALSI